MSGEEKGAFRGWLLLLVVLLFMSCTSKHVETKIVAGKTVHKVSEYYSAGWGMPFHDGIAREYWVYTDSAGSAIKHGPYKTFYGNGQLEYEANYLNGKQDGPATRWSTDGKIAQQTFWRGGDQTGWANYDQGGLTYAIESVFEGDHAVATKKFEQGHWSLQFICGNKIDLAIDPQSGGLIPLSGPERTACRQ